MIDRYTRKPLARIWSDENKFTKWLEVELAVCEAQAELGYIPKDAVTRIKKKATFDVNRVLEIEREVKHDVIAFLTNVAEEVGPDARFIHLGMTSNDVLDTSLSLVMQEAGVEIMAGLEKLKTTLLSRAREHQLTYCIGRTHGIHAELTTFGLKLMLWYEETCRNIARFRDALAKSAVAKISGAVGTFEHLDPRIEEIAAEKLALKPINCTQVVPRDIHADYLSSIALIGASLEKFATEIRNLQRTELLEAEEYFSKGQKGSSAMPHKRNPITCERIAGMARLLRANSSAGLENVALWHERDITHSSVERVIIPDSTTLLDYMLHKFNDVMEKLIVYPENMQENINRTRGLIFSQRLLLQLTGKGMAREEAYKIIQDAAMKVWSDPSLTFHELVKKETQVTAHLTNAEISNCFNVENSLNQLEYLFERGLQAHQQMQ